MAEDPRLYDAALRATDSVCGTGTYEELHRNNPNPWVQDAIRRSHMTTPETPFYVRDTEGEVYHVETLEEALAAFVSDKGYRLTLRTESHEVVIRREDERRPGLLPTEVVYLANITVRDRSLLYPAMARKLEQEDLPCEHEKNRDQCEECNA